MTNLANVLVGPLVAPECRRSASRGWVFVTRTLAGIVVGIVALAALGWWSINQQYDGAYLPGGLVAITAIIIECIAVLLGLFLSPAVLAGSLAGEKERGSIGLLLSTTVDAREIVLGRVLGKLSLVGSLLLACLPFQVLFGGLSGLSAGSILVVILLPASVAFGAGGLAVAASAVARRGRNALMAVYFLEVALLMAITISLIPGLGWAGEILGVVNPFFGVLPLMGFGLARTALATVAVWCVFGVSGIAFASWRLRSSYLRLVDGKKERFASRRRAIPEVPDDAVMVWKERYIEKVSALGWFGRLLNLLLVLYLGLGSLGMAIYAALIQYGWIEGNFDAVVTRIYEMYGVPAFWICILIQLAAGLRAAVAIASERERGTWDGLLTSPLTGGEILTGKLRGSLYSLVPLLLSAVLAWAICAACLVMPVVTFLALIGYVTVGVIFVVSVGVRASLATQTATKAMTITVATLMGAYFVLAILAGLLLAIVLIVGIIAMVFSVRIGLSPPNARPWFPSWFAEACWHLGMIAGFLILATMIVSESKLRFDKLAGRMQAEGGEAPPQPVWESVPGPHDKTPNQGDGLAENDGPYRGSPAVGSASP